MIDLMFCFGQLVLEVLYLSGTSQFYVDTALMFTG
jgi:hypothetical protein